jgi:transcription elongation factor Elf1
MAFLPRTLAHCEDTVTTLEQQASVPEDDQRASARHVTLTCPRCGHVDRMTAELYALWPAGVRCGMCGPPYRLMRVHFDPMDDSDH